MRKRIFLEIEREKGIPQIKMAGNFYSEYKIPRHILVRIFNFKITERTLQAFRKKIEITFQKTISD